MQVKSLEMKKKFLIFLIIVCCGKEQGSDISVRENLPTNEIEQSNNNTTSSNQQPIEVSSFADNDLNNEVMMQAFWWSSYNDSRIASYESYYDFINAHLEDFSQAHIDLLWLPPTSDSADGMGYHPRELYNLNSLHGNENQLRNLLDNLKSRKIHAMADLIFNHRAATGTWTDFFNPTWSCESICIDDEATNDPNAFGTKPCGDPDEGINWGSARDLNHKSLEVQNGLKEYIVKLKNIGFDSWRYDYAQGYPAKYIASYNDSAPYYYAVAEVWNGNIDSLKHWIDTSRKTTNDKIVRRTAVFDFALKYKLNESIVQKMYHYLDIDYSLASHEGYKDKGITFLDNHDSGCVNHDNCEALFSSDANEIAQGYAYLLTHPGIPMIWIYHYLFIDPTGALKDIIDGLIIVRKENGIHANSKLEVVETMNGDNGYYVAEIDDKLLVKIGSGEFEASEEWSVVRSYENIIIWTKS